MATRATQWVDAQHDKVDQRLENVQDLWYGKANKPFNTIRRQIRKPFAIAGRKVNAVSEKAFDRHEQIFDKSSDVLSATRTRVLPHPRQRWQKVRTAPTFDGRLVGAAELVTIGATRLLGEVTYGAVYATNLTLRFATGLALALTSWGTRLAVATPGWGLRLGVFGARVAVVGTPLVALAATRLTAAIAAYSTMAALETPSFASRLAGAGTDWVRRGARWLVHGLDDQTQAPAEVEVPSRRLVRAEVTAQPTTKAVAAKSKVVSPKAEKKLTGKKVDAPKAKSVKSAPRSDDLSL